MLSNLTAGDREQVAAVCAAGVVPKLLDMAAHEEYDTVTEEARRWAALDKQAVLEYTDSDGIVNEET